VLNALALVNANNAVSVAGPGSLWNNVSNLTVGSHGPSGYCLTILDGGAVVDLNGSATGSNSVLVSGSGAVWSNRQNMNLSGPGTPLVISNGGRVFNGAGSLNNAGAVLVRDPTSIWSNRSGLYVGSDTSRFGGHNLMISNGAAVFNSIAYIGVALTEYSNNTVHVIGNGSVWNCGGTLSVVGGGGSNTLFISDGGKVSSSNGVVGGTNRNGVVISGTGSVWSNSGTLTIDARNSVIVSNGAGMLSGSAILGPNYDFYWGYSNSISVVGNGSVWSNQNTITIGVNSSGNSLIISNGGKVFTTAANIGYYYYGPSNLIKVSGTNSLFYSTGSLTIGGMESGGDRLLVENGGQVLDGFGRILNSGIGGPCDALITGAGSLWSNQTLTVAGSLVVSNGGQVVSEVGTINSTTKTSLVAAAGTFTSTNLYILSSFRDSGNVIVTNSTHDATLEVRCGKFFLDSGLLDVDRFVMTNACAQFVRTGGTLIYNIAVLDSNRDDDGDGIPNGWEQAHGLDPLNAADGNVDSDGDGMSNLQEYLAGTDPNDSASAFRITGVATEANDLRVTWMMGSGKTNALQAAAGDGGYYTNDFADIFTVTNTVGSVTNYLDLGAGTNMPGRFYRVRLVP
jgi:T5SS/PEP-CTERM-associated repeat protein